MPWLLSYQAGHFLAGAGKEVHSLLPQAPILLSLSTQLAKSQRVLHAHVHVSQQHCWASETSPGQCGVPRVSMTSPGATVGTAIVPMPGCWGCTVAAQEVTVSIPNPPPWLPCIPGKPRGIPAGYPSRFKMLSTEAVEDLGVEKQLPRTGCAKSIRSHGEGSRFGDIKDRYSDGSHYPCCSSCRALRLRPCSRQKGPQDRKCQDPTALKLQGAQSRWPQHPQTSSGVPAPLPVTPRAPQSRTVPGGCQEACREPGPRGCPPGTDGNRAAHGPCPVAPSLLS